MTTNSDFDRNASAWLADGPTELADRVLDAALREVHVTHQRRRLAALSWRTPALNIPLRVAAGISIVAVLGFAALTFLGRAPGYGAGPTPSPTSAASPIALVSPAPSSAAQATLDTTTWTTYTSSRYGFTIGHPTDWPVVPSTRAWAFPADATSIPLSVAETFHTPANDVGVSAWSLAVAPGTTTTTWLQLYCPVAAANSTCSSLEGRTTRVSMDGHDGSLVAFKDDTQAFILIGNRMYIVGCWRPESDPSLVPYGGAIRLLEGYLSTMHLLPASTPGPTVRPS